MHVATSLKLLLLFPLFFANYAWINWKKSCMWLRVVWFIMTSMPFVTLSVPSRFLINFGDLIRKDVFLLKEEVMIHYNLNDTLKYRLGEAAKLCSGDLVAQVEGKLQTAAWIGSKAKKQF